MTDKEPSSPSPLVVKSIEVPVGVEAPFMTLFLADTHLTLCDARDNGWNSDLPKRFQS